MQNVTSAIKDCYKKPVPKTFDAVCIGGHYKDPRILCARIKSTIAASAVAFCIAYPFLTFLR